MFNESDDEEMHQGTLEPAAEPKQSPKKKKEKKDKSPRKSSLLEKA